VEWRSDAPNTRLWIRCHTDLSALGGTADPALLVRFYSAYEVFLNGQEVGGSGNMQGGEFSLGAIKFYDIPKSGGPAVIALRAVDRGKRFSPGPVQRLMELGLEMKAGDRALLEDVRAGQVLEGASGYSTTVICYGVVGVLSIPLLGLFLFDRSKKAVLLLALAAIAVSTLRMNEFAAASFVDYPLVLCILIMIGCNLLLTCSEFPFFFMLARGRVPVWVRWFLVLPLLSFVPMTWDYFSPERSELLRIPVIRELVLISMFSSFLTMSLLPIVAFWPLGKVTRRMGPLAALCIVWGLTDFVWFAVEATALGIPGVPNLYAPWGTALLNARGMATAFVVTALVGFLFREQRQIALDRATLAGELQAAGEIQRMLASAEIDMAPGMRIDVAFHPMREVGGDFYLCRVLKDGRQRILLGDVSGKGAAAAMAGTLLLGAAEERAEDSPAELLRHMNRVLCRARIGSFATCLCVDVNAAWEMVLANAGHLSPYRDGNEIGMPGCLPLGIEAGTEYAEARIKLETGDAVTFVSDGVVEARNRTGELFGFERTARVSTGGAQQIAQAAREFGQEDDITVVRLQAVDSEQ
jgi:hypothetical protein